MTQGKITASAAMLNVLKTWGVDTILWYPIRNTQLIDGRFG